MRNFWEFCLAHPSGHCSGQKQPATLAKKAAGGFISEELTLELRRIANN